MKIMTEPKQWWSVHPEVTRRIDAALKSMFIADALAMPVHWYYNPYDIEKAFPGGIKKFEAAPAYHPSSIMSLHSTSKGGRGDQSAALSGRDIVGDVILKGRKKYWNKPNQHYHSGMRAGENTLNTHCTRVLIRSLTAHEGHYSKEQFLEDYIAFMTADPPQHPDTYAESYHRGFFANLENGKSKENCGAQTHDTASIGGLVTIAPLVFAERLNGKPLEEVQSLCHEHLYLTHPDESLAFVCQSYVELLNNLLMRPSNQSAAELLARAAKQSLGFDLPRLVEKTTEDRDIIGGAYSPACYISDSWPSVLYLAYKYLDRPLQGLLANTNLGGDNAHRGVVLGIILGLANATTQDDFFAQLTAHRAIETEINGLISAALAPATKNGDSTLCSTI